MPNVRTSHETPRGCGYRSKGSRYFVSDPGTLFRPCGKLPLKLDRCPTCDHGIKPARSWTWIDPKPLFGNVICKRAFEPFSIETIERAGLLWVGSKFYPRPEDWIKEAVDRGASRRISAVPKDFKVGETWVFVAHREAIVEKCPACFPADKEPNPTGDCEVCDGNYQLEHPAIFHAFKPTRIEYVITGKETTEELDAMEKRGLSLVDVVRVGENPELPLETQNEQEAEG